MCIRVDGTAAKILTLKFLAIMELTMKHYKESIFLGGGGHPVYYFYYYYYAIARRPSSVCLSVCL